MRLLINAIRVTVQFLYFHPVKDLFLFFVRILGIHADAQGEVEKVCEGR